MAEVADTSVAEAADTLVAVESADTSVVVEAVVTSVALVTLEAADTLKALGLLEDAYYLLAMERLTFSSLF